MRSANMATLPAGQERPLQNCAPLRILVTVRVHRAWRWRV